MQERLQKILSARGIASRRKAEEYIKQGLVLVNGKPAVLGQKADPAVDKIEVKGEVMKERQEMLYYVMNKPKGVETSNVIRYSNQRYSMQKPDSTNRITNNEKRSNNVPTVRDLLPPELRGKVYPVGRLDKDSTGLLLLTNDGVLAYRLTHPKFEHEKEYEVETEEDIKDGQLRKFREGMTLSGEKTKPAKVVRTGPRNFRIALTEGKNRQIRRMCQKVGCPVKELKRVRIVTLQDDKLTLGSIRLLSQHEINELLMSIGNRSLVLHAIGKSLAL